MTSPFILALFLSSASIRAADFNYIDSGKDWPETHDLCHKNYTQQSPINIPDGRKELSEYGEDQISVLLDKKLEMSLSWGSDYGRQQGKDIDSNTGAPYFIPSTSNKAAIKVIYTNPFTQNSATLVDLSELVRI
jgi:hypothetical protein